MNKIKEKEYYLNTANNFVYRVDFVTKDIIISTLVDPKPLNPLNGVTARSVNYVQKYFKHIPKLKAELKYES